MAATHSSKRFRCLEFVLSGEMFVPETVHNLKEKGLLPQFAGSMLKPCQNLVVEFLLYCIYRDVKHVLNARIMRVFAENNFANSSTPGPRVMS
jgi:hypothetical protein